MSSSVLPRATEREMKIGVPFEIVRLVYFANNDQTCTYRTFSEGLCGGQPQLVDALVGLSVLLNTQYHILMRRARTIKVNYEATRSVRMGKTGVIRRTTKHG